VQRPQVLPHDRAAVRVRAVEHDLVALQAVLLHQLGADRLGQLAADADEVERHEHAAPALGVFQDQRLRPQLSTLAFGRMLARREACHPHGLGRRDDGLGSARAPALGGGEGGRMKRQAGYEEGEKG